MHTRSKNGRRSVNKSLFPELQSEILLTTETRRESETPLELAKRRSPYSRFYAALKVLRGEFHRIGQFDDANAKLDELCKLLVLTILDSRHPLPKYTSRLSSEYLTMSARLSHGSETRLAAAIHDVYDELASRYPDEMTAFGMRNGLNMSPRDDEFAAALLPLLDALPRANNNDCRWSFDSVNEAFGHFVQDSFRNRKEDAQYMTPPEVVSSIVDIAIHDIVGDLNGKDPGKPILVADPTCGVGSFLAAMWRHASHIPLDTGMLSDHLRIFGQDKVVRMVRLACVNLKLFAGVNADIRQGNSVLPPSSLAELDGKVDLILTNPPFGATFDVRELMSLSTESQLPTLHHVARRQPLPKMLDSEYILLDRALALLRPGGRLLIVVPDHVVSTGGFAESFRRAMGRSANLLAVFDLPTETFAQAGTRTKTSVVYLQRKTECGGEIGSNHVFMATSEDLGFRVVLRAGATVKRIVGQNDLDAIADVYGEFRRAESPRADIVCLSRKPSIAAVAFDRLLNNRWTAGFYQTERLQALQRIEVIRSNGFTHRKLLDAVIVDPDSKERVLADERNRCISVLHVREDGCIDLRAVNSYRPTTACTRCRPGDVLLSKINPRIMRICVVPETPWDLACSTEFAVLRSKNLDITPWLLMLLMRSDVVQAQVRTLTSGTSSSHNRIKHRDLETIVIPVPKQNSKAMAQLHDIASRLQRATLRYYQSIAAMTAAFRDVEKLFGR